jgi:hypothetical protein
MTIFGRFDRLGQLIRWVHRQSPGHPWQDADLEGVPMAFPRLLVGTCRKSGTVWLRQIFSEVSVRTRAEFHHSLRCKLHDGDRRWIHLDTDSTFAGIDRARTRGLRMIRDPRDMVISSMHYHRRSSEPWPHRPRGEGMTYQEKSRAL